MAIEVKAYEEFKVLGFMRYFSARVQQSSKNRLTVMFLGSILDIFDIVEIWLKNSTWNPKIGIPHEILLLYTPILTPWAQNETKRNEFGVKNPSVPVTI